MSRRYAVSTETRDRIVRAAGEVFGEHGFQSTTIRAITARAGVNVAAVNYHFRDKSELYLHVLREAKCHAGRFSLADQEIPPEERLRDFLEGFLHHLLDSSQPAWHAQVLMQEMLHPTEAIEVLVNELIGPLYLELRALVADLIDRPVARDKLDLATASILGQCLFYRRSRPIVERLSPALLRNPGQIAEHIASFTLAALRTSSLVPSKNRSFQPRVRADLSR